MLKKKIVCNKYTGITRKYPYGLKKGNNVDPETISAKNVEYSPKRIQKSILCNLVVIIIQDFEVLPSIQMLVFHRHHFL